MRKTSSPQTAGRVLARVLAEDLRNIEGGGIVLPEGGTPETTTINGHLDWTNVGGDGDNA